MSTFDKQLPLALNLPDDETFASYYGAANDSVVEQLKLLLDKNEQPFYLWGAAGCGKSHLLHAACADGANRGMQVAYLPMSISSQISPIMFEGLEQLDLVAIDDVDHIAGDAVWESALFDLYNRVGELGQARLLMSAKGAPRTCGFQLPDLGSRLDWGLVAKLSSLDDEQKVAMLMQRAQNRGMKMPDEVARFLLNRVAREMGALTETLDTLDRASMVAQRKLTVPFVKQVLSL
ncbi:DnaA inactivator Hda [Corallincola luteus]|uniref:DnaA inactivator Hda n=2 Tax=Corallincola TaxID=1775176 RepID=A0A368NLX8_9GAMM|nr:MULTISPECIES: DnaA inactivator Hda [Corallincola]RCU50331.1 DnaA inactivator Hda [Corallincola holothuriorum]TCI05484.1 DnaA inactivator Hda [Corallincola luteus]